mgnify:CR=1 FL=1
MTIPPRKNPAGRRIAAQIKTDEIDGRSVEALHTSRGQTGGDVDQREQRSVRVREREHQSPRLVADIEIPADLEAVQCFERAAEREKNEKRPPAES